MWAIIIYYKEKIVLIGESDLDFIVEYFCMNNDLRFVRAAANAPENGAAENPGAQAFIFYSENIAMDEVFGDGGSAGVKGRCMMREVL